MLTVSHITPGYGKKQVLTGLLVQMGHRFVV
jgi:hypothetical protein